MRSAIRSEKFREKIFNNRSTNSVAFAQNSECLSYPLTQIISPSLNSRISATHDKG